MEPGLGGRQGPVTEFQAAAGDYETRFGWPCNAYTEAVWLYLPHWMSAIDLRQPLADKVIDALPEPAPVVAHPDGRRVIIARCFQPHEVHEPMIGHHHPRAMIDLPPSRLWIGTLTWHRPPCRDLPLCGPILSLARRIRDQT